MARHDETCGRRSTLRYAPACCVHNLLRYSERYFDLTEAWQRERLHDAFAAFKDLVITGGLGWQGFKNVDTRALLLVYLSCAAWPVVKFRDQPLSLGVE